MDDGTTNHLIGIYIIIFPQNISLSVLYIPGTLTLPTSALREPPPNLKVRDVKQWYVDYLAEKLTMDDKEVLASPLLVVASVGKEEFRPERLASYTYKVSIKAWLCKGCMHACRVTFS